MGGCRQRAIALFGGLALFFHGDRASAQVYQLAELDIRQIQALDRQRAVVVIPGGILEQHGPCLPSCTDAYAIAAHAGAQATAIVSRPGRTVVMFPQIPLANDPVNTPGGLRRFPGTSSAAMGAQEVERASATLAEHALRILDGLDSSSILRFVDEMDPLDTGERDELAYEKTMEKRQEDWLAAHHAQ